MAVWKNSQVKEWRNYDEAKRVMFHKSNKWDAAEDILCRESTSGVKTPPARGTQRRFPPKHTENTIYF